MTEKRWETVENGAKEPWLGAVNEHGRASEISGVILKTEEEESMSSCQDASPKNRRKISKPKHYKPSSTDGDDDEHNDIHGDLNGSASSPESIVQDQGGEVAPENAVHVMTTSPAGKQVGPSPTSKRAVNSQKPKRPQPTKPIGKKQKHEAPTVPRKPEDLIKEALILGQGTPPASKRDAQYRKSYAYKIWKERGNQEVMSDAAEERNGTGGTKAKLPPGPLQNQARAAFYWPASQFNGSAPPGFFANGKYYAMNPNMIPSINGVPQVSPTPPNVPKSSVTVTNGIHAIPSPVIQSSNTGVVSSSHQRAHFPGVIGGTENTRRDVPKVGPPNVVVVPQYPSTARVSTHVPKLTVKSAMVGSPGVKSPGVISPGIISPPAVSPVVKSPVSKVPSLGVKTPPLSKAPSSVTVAASAPVPPVASSAPVPPVSAAETADAPRRASRAQTTLPQSSENESPGNNFSSSPSDLVSIMKTSLRQKHSKENVQPRGNIFKSKRKLDTDRNDGPPPKKSGKPTIFTPLNEHEAEKLANDIYDVNLEYFPFETLAEKAVQSEETLPETPERSEKGSRVKEIEKVRCLLKDFYDITFSCTEDPDMQKFDSASRKFGRKNILNHLSLLDRYFAELQKKLDT